jgi:small-conductance mechanosensitive channel
LELISSIIGIIIFSLYDYFGFHISHRKGWEDFTPVNPYRISQFTVQAALTIILYILYGWYSALAFNILWWTWWADLLFYLWYDLLRIFGYPRKPGGFREQVLGNKVTWAYWTAWGVLRFKHKDTVMTKNAIFIQAFTGMLFVTIFYLIIYTS